MAFLSSVSKGNGGCSSKSGTSGRTTSRGGYFSRIRRNESNSSSSSSSGGGVVSGVPNMDCGGGSVCQANSDYGLLEMDENDNSFPWGLLHHNELALMLNSGLGKTMVIDSRSFLEHNTTNIQQSINVCCSKLVKRRLQQDKVHVLDLLCQTCHIAADASWDVIVYDQCTEDPSLLTADNFVHVLLRKLSTAFNSVAFLKGGFLAFQASHSNLVENKSSNYRCSTLTSLSQPCMPVSNIGPTRILSFLYLGSQQDSLAHEVAQVNGITYILNVSKTCPRPPFILENHFYRIPINDNYCEKLLPFFQEAFQFLDKVHEANGCALVHCVGGVSRSATLTIAYIMKHMKMSSDDAYRYVKDKRPNISPNFNFLGQLLEYEKIVRKDEVDEAARREAIRVLRGGTEDGASGVSDRSSPMSAMDLHTSSPSSPGPRSASRSFTLETLSPSVISPLAQQTPTQSCPFPGPAVLMEESISSQPPACDSQKQQVASPSPRTSVATTVEAIQSKQTSSSSANVSSTSTPGWQAGRESCLFPSPLCELRPYPGPSYQNPAYTQPPSLNFRDGIQNFNEADVNSSSCDRTVSSETSDQPTKPPNLSAQSPVCSITGFPSPASASQEGPSSTCLLTGFPSPATPSRSQIPHHNSLAHDKCHISSRTEHEIISSRTSTYHSPDLKADPCPGPTLSSDSQVCNQSAAISPAESSQPKGKQGFSLSSMLSSFRWRSRPPTLSLGSPVGLPKDRRKRGETTVLGTQLTPVSEASENCDLPFADSDSVGGNDSENLNSDLRNSGGESAIGHLSVSGIDSLRPSPSALYSHSASAVATGAGLSNTTNSKNMKIFPAKTRSLKLKPRNFFLSLSSPSSEFYISTALSSASSLSSSSAAAAMSSPIASSSRSLQPSVTSPSSGKQSLSSPGDSNKRKSGFLSHFNSPDKLARKEDPSLSNKPLSPPKTLNLAPNQLGSSKPRQRLGIKKPTFLTLSSPTAAMARLNFTSPSNPTKDFPSSSVAADQNREIDASAALNSSEKNADLGLLLCSANECLTVKTTGASARDLATREQHHYSEDRQQCNRIALTESALSALSASTSSSSSSQASMSTSHSSALEASSSSEGALSSSMSSSSTSSSVNYQGLGRFPTTSLDKLSFTPCSVRDIVQDLKNSDVSKCEDQCSLLTDSQGPSSALDSPMSISSGSSAPSLASSTLSPVDCAMPNPFPSTSSSGRDIAEDGSLTFPLFSHRPHQPDRPDDSFTDSGVQSAADQQAMFPSSQDNSSAACTPDSMLSPTSSLPQASISPSIPNLTSPCYSFSSSTEPLSPMSLDDSNSNSPIYSPSGGVCVVSSLSSFPITSPVSSIHSLVSNSSHVAVSPSPLVHSSSSSSSPASKVVLRKERGKRMVLARPNSIAFSSYPTCDLVPATVSNASHVANTASSRDDASEEFMAVSNKRSRPLLSPDGQGRTGRTSWGGYSEREVYRQITEAMESAMLRTQAYIPHHSTREAHLPSNISRKARSLDDIMDNNDDEQDFQSGSTPAVDGNSSGGSDRPAGHGRFRVGFSPEKSLPVSMLFEQYHCGIRGGPESYQSNSSLSSNGSHSSIHSSLEIIQVS